MELTEAAIANQYANPVLQVCADSTRAALMNRGEVRSFEAGAIFLGEGEAAGVAVLPLQGAFQMVKTTSRGRRQVMCDPGQFGCTGICLFAFGGTSLADFKGLTDGQVLLVPRAEIESLAGSDAALAGAAWQSVAHCMAHLSDLVAQLSFNKVAERINTLLLEGTEHDGDLVRLTQSDLAAEVGTTREVVARCLAGLQAERVVRLGRGRIAVLDREKLAALR